MNPVDIIVAVVILVVVGLPVWYIRKWKKAGKKCIGCPDSCACSGGNCSGGCTGCKEK